MKHLRISLLVLSLLAAAAPAHARPSALGSEIAAVAGTDAISVYDVNSRMKFLIVTSRLPDNADTVNRLRPQVVRALVDEKLQMRHAEKHEIAISDAEVAQAIADIEKDRGIPEGGIFKLMREHHIPKEAFTDQIRVQMAWRKLILKKVRPGIRISDEEVDIARKTFREAPVVAELKIAVLTLPVDSPQSEQDTRRAIAKLAAEIQGGASFEEVSRQFTGGGGKSEAFWVRPGQLDPQMAQALAGAKTGAIAGPVQTQAGYAIVKVYDVKAVEKQQEPGPEWDERIRNRIFQQKMELAAQKYMRDLKRDIFIEIR